MIFVGDIAIPFKDAITVKNLPNNLFHKKWFGNLEGGIVENSSIYKKEKMVFNDYKAIESLSQKFDFVGFGLANNHIIDAVPLKKTLENLTQLKIAHCGVGDSLDEASNPLLVQEDGIQIAILNFGWQVIQCNIASNNISGVNPLTRKNVIDSVLKTQKKFPAAKIITFMHWSYELEAEPQPFERELAKYIIHLGVSAVIGCHPHRIGGIEFFEGKPIIYSLGNWLFKQNYYHNGKLKFPSFCDKELAFEINFHKNELIFYFFDYCESNSELVFSHSIKYDDENSIIKPPFTDLNKKDYIKWYKLNHYHKNKGLPVYRWDDSIIKIRLKNIINRIRDILILLFWK